MEWLIGFLAAGVFHFLELLGRFRSGLGLGKNRQDTLEGKWYGYHFSRRNRLPILRREMCSIKRIGSKKYLITLSSEGEYRGYLTKERGHIIIHLEGTGDYGSHFDLRMEEPIPENKIVAGLWVSFDFDGRIIAGPEILSRDMLSDDEAKGYLRNLVHVTNPDERLLGLLER